MCICEAPFRGEIHCFWSRLKASCILNEAAEEFALQISSVSAVTVRLIVCRIQEMARLSIHVSSAQNSNEKC